MKDNEFTTRLPDPADQAAAIEQERLDLAFKSREAEKKAAEERAKSRLKDDAGNALCEECGAVIPPKRLEILPHALLCVGCQAHSEIIDKRFV
jgi:DnaK suppressor protein